MHDITRCGLILALVGSLGGLSPLAACSRGETPPGPVPDIGVDPDGGGPDPDVGVGDTGGTPPDFGPPPDLGPPCGNGWLDADETCDKAIPAGQNGACPTDCDDDNACTEDTVVGSVEHCAARCEHRVLANCCGNGVPEAGEECDDGNTVESDACDELCKLPGGHLLLTEAAIAPTVAEFIELYNPSAAPVALDTVYISDRADYFQLPTGEIKGVGSDFIARFPDGAVLAPGAYAVVATDGLGFKTTYGKAADYELRKTDDDTPDMISPTDKSLGAVAGLTDGGEMVVLFTWDGQSDLVQDLDYVAWKGSSETAVEKTSATCVDGADADETPSCYQDDTPAASQSTLAPPKADGSMHRCNYLEGQESPSGGNGALGHDETSEELVATWALNASSPADRSPGEGPTGGHCTPTR